MKKIFESYKSKITESSISDDWDLNHEYGVFRTGGSIGWSDSGVVAFFGRNAGTLVSTFQDANSAKEFAKKRHKGLSPGERKYYGMTYRFKQLGKSEKEQMQKVMESINESNVQNILRNAGFNEKSEAVKGEDSFEYKDNKIYVYGGPMLFATAKEISNTLKKNKIKHTVGDDGHIVLESEEINEIDRNDPVLISLRATKDQREKDVQKIHKEKKNRVYGKQRDKLEMELIALNNEIKNLVQGKNELFKDMDLEAGQKDDWSDEDANRYGEEINGIDEELIKLISRRNKIEAKLYA